MANCICCGKEYSVERYNLGYRVCLSCGDKLAWLEVKSKEMRTAPLFNKGGYQYITDGNSLKSLGRKV